MELEKAKLIADKYIQKLSPYCVRIEIAGSIRRRKPEVKDIEIVCIRNTRKLFDFVTEVNKLKKIKGGPTGKYTQRQLPEGIVLDLFFAIPENWGLIFAIRTGSASFSHNVLGKGWVKAGYKSINGILMKGNITKPVFEERELFDLIGMDYVEPGKREFQELFD